jgi:HlyD family secretion protein
MQTLERPSSNGHARVTTVPISPPRPTRPWRAALAVVVALALIITGVLVFRARSASAVTYVTSPVVRGDLVQTVTATGTVNPQNTIDIGTQVSGTISEVDVDYNSKVHRGQVLARIDPTALAASVNSAKAALAQAQAQAAAANAAANGSAIGVATAQAAAVAAAANARAALATAQSNQQAIASADAGVTKAQSALVLAQQTVTRDRQLLTQGYIAQNQEDTDASNLVAAQAALQSAQVAAQQARSTAVASVAQAQASMASTVSQTDAVDAARAAAAGSVQSAAAQTAAIGIAQASVEQAQTNLDHAVITSPVDGTVIARDVSVGTTVAASLQTPTLFEIAQDLSKMEVDLAVGEPDIGSVRPGEAVDFTVLAYPARTFHGVVSQVRKNPVTTSNVVTYTTVVLVDNADQALLPGMTANATIHVQTASNALVVPTAALGYAPAFGGSGTHHHAAGTTASPWGATTGAPATALTSGSQGRIFVLRAGKLVRVPVALTLVTSTQAAVTPQNGATLAAGDAVVTGDSANAGAARPQHAGAAVPNPLAGGAAGVRLPR